MDPYDAELAPTAVGLVNTGVSCYFNAFLQALTSCTAFVRTASANRGLLVSTRTGRALLEYLAALGLGGDGRNPGPAARPLLANPANGSAMVLTALMADLAERRPNVRFGHGQESASEALVHLLDMLVPAADSPGASNPAAPPAPLEITSPLTDLFLHRSTCSVYCLECRQIASQTRDYAVTFHLFHFDQVDPRSPADFVRAMNRHVSALEDYRCEKCGARSPALRVYTLTMVPEILFCAFNLYTDRRSHWFPERLDFPGSTPGELLQYRLVGQIEHSGTLHGGHYWARCLRQTPGGLRVHLLNDMSVAPSAFAPTPSTYLVAYHFEAWRRCAVGEWEDLARPGAKRGVRTGGCPPA